MSTHENFEDFLKQSADELQMRPSAAVWEALNKRLADSRRRTFLLSGLFLLCFFATGYLLNKAPLQPANPVTASKASATITPIPSSSTITPKNTTSIVIASNRLTPKQIAYSAPAIETITQPSVTTHNTAPATINNPFVAESNNPILPPATTATAATGTNTLNNKPGVAKKESATVSHTADTKSSLRRRKWSFQYYFTPTVSYRRLTDAPTFNLALSSASPSTSVDNAVFHKPDIGFEVGTAARYSISKRVRLRTGLQLSLHRYDIRAYDYVPEVAPIALNSGYSQPVIINTITTHRNTDGFRTDWLQNSYVKISAPIGLETRIRGNEKTYIGVAGTLQPSYLLGDRAYLLSADFKNYAEAANLVRRWNMSTSVETFVNYSTGHLQWQVGPQVRYQLMSSFIKAYPVKENLFDFGFKVGISANRAPQPK